MKYCSKCGNQMADDMMFCQKCGTKAVESVKSEEIVKTKNEPIYTESANSYREQPSAKSNAPGMRKGMKVGMIICFILAGLYSLISIAEPMILGAGFFFAVLGIMFLLLGKSPKGEKYIFGKLKKGAFITICIAVAFVFVIVFAANTEPQNVLVNASTEQNFANNPVENEQNETNLPVEENEKVSLTDIKKWYEKEMPAVSQSLIDYSNGVKGISNMNVTSSKFRFGEDDGWYDCHYTFTFTCKVNGEKCFGEARAFRKYNDSNIDWFHFEIARDSDWATIVEEYDESSDATIESYYRELEEKYE